jgi:hypothetical protein
MGPVNESDESCLRRRTASDEPKHAWRVEVSDERSRVTATQFAQRHACIMQFRKTGAPFPV